MSMKKEKRLLWSVVISIIICIISIPIMFIYTNSALKSDIGDAIFNEIADLSVLDKYAVSELSIDSDKNLGEMSPIESYCKVINYSGKKYRIRAYVFERMEDAAAYCDNDIGYEPRNGKACFLSNSFSHTKYIIIYDNRVMLIEGGKLHDFIKFKEFLFTEVQNVLWFRDADE